MNAHRIYIAGRMSGLPEHGYPAFVEAEKLLRERGYTEILNPIHHSDGVGTGMPYDYYIRASIEDVLKSDLICVLPEWELSKGARLEVHMGIVLGLPIYTLDKLLSKSPEHILNFKIVVEAAPDWIGPDGKDPWAYV